jgi:uncharacterized protein (TIGR03086 family)
MTSTTSRSPLELLEVADDEFARRLRLVGPGDWQRPTPCAAWDVRALVNHVVGANVRYQLLLEGAPTERVEATRAVDHLGHDAVASFDATAERVVARFREDGASERVVHHLVGDRTGRELLSMRILDVAVHAWDLARALSVDEALDEEVVAFLLAFTVDRALAPRSFAPASADVPRGASPQDQLLHRLGRNPTITRGRPMSETTRFLDEMLPRIHEAETALHNGDPGPRFDMWSHTDPVTVFGAAFSPIGWAEVGPMFEKIASNFANCSSCEWEVVAADVGRDFAYLLAIERTTASVGGSEATPYMLRSTTIFRRENGQWKIVHRHADPIGDAAELLSGLQRTR